MGHAQPAALRVYLNLNPASLFISLTPTQRHHLLVQPNKVRLPPVDLALWLDGIFGAPSSLRKA